MAKYKKVKRYHRSFYSPGMWVKKAVGIIVLVAVVLVVGWLAAPHVLDWATHTWYTVVRNRDLSASSETTASSAAASSEVTAEPAASSEVRVDSEPESEPAAPAGVIIEAAGAFWTRLQQRMKFPCVPPPSSWPSRVRSTPSSP